MDKRHLILTTLAALIFSCSSLQTKKHRSKAFKYKLTPELNRPYGTITNLQIVIIDGDSLRMKETQSKFYARVKKIDDKVIADTLIISFDDRSGYFPEDVTNLYWHIYDHRPEHGVSMDTTKILKKDYVGKTFNVAAYESGFFWGMPDNYTNYAGIRAEPSFHFRSILVIVADINRPNKDE